MTGVQTCALPISALDQADFSDGAQPDYVYYLLDDGVAEQAVVTEVGGAAVEMEPADALEAQATNVNDTYLNSSETTISAAEKANRSWQLGAVNAYDAWDVVKANKGATVAVLDSGCLVTHKDIAANIVGTYNAVVGAQNKTDGTNLDTSDVTDLHPSGHGTHVAGIIAGQANNGRGMAGVSYNAGILPVCVMYKRASDGAIVATSLNTIEGLTYAIENKARYNIRVINMSLGKVVRTETLPPKADGSKSNDQLLVEKVQEATDAGILVTMAAGNSNLAATPYRCFPIDFCPSALGVINVQNTSPISIGSTSNYNVEGTMAKLLSAPGTNIWSLAKTGDADYRYSTGTSMASPCVASIAALLFVEKPGLTPAQVKSILCSTATDLNADGFDDTTGYGLVNAYDAVRMARVYLDGPDFVTKGSSVAITPSLYAAREWTWASSDESVATVDAHGTVTGVSSGAVSISATYHGKMTSDQGITAVKSLTVIDPRIEGHMRMMVSDTETFAVVDGGTGTWTWSTSNASVATVGASSGVVSGKKAGKEPSRQRYRATTT